MKVKEIMTRDLAYVRHNQTITEAAEKMKRLKVGDLPVLAGEDAVGMVTDRDVVVRTVAHGLDPKVTHVIDAMTEGVISCKEDDPIQKAAQMMGKHQIRRLPVMNDQKEMTGMVSLGDLALNLDKDSVGQVLRDISR